MPHSLLSPLALCIFSNKTQCAVQGTPAHGQSPGEFHCLCGVGAGELWVFIHCLCCSRRCHQAHSGPRAHPAPNNGHHRLHTSARQSQGAQTDHSQSPTVCLNNNNVRANKRLFPSAKSPSPLMVPLSLPLPHPLPKTASALALLLLAPFSSSPPFLSTSRLFLGFSPPILHLGPSSLRIHGAPSSPPG